MHDDGSLDENQRIDDLIDTFSADAAKKIVESVIGDQPKIGGLYYDYDEQADLTNLIHAAIHRLIAPK